MPITFIDIEKQKSSRIALLFAFLLFLYFMVTAALFQGISFIFPVLFFKSGSFLILDSPRCFLSVLALSVIAASVHFGVSAFNAVQSVIGNLGASRPDPEDGIHKRLMNIMEELHIATGTKRRIKCMVIPSLSMNALAVTDLRGDAVIAITEGLLSRLTRPQTEAVIAHEAYHILSGDCLETSIASSLFGVHASMLEKLKNLGDDRVKGLHPVFWLFWILLKLSILLSMFISREREYRADAASLRMTRNPLAMAETLYLLSRNWRGEGLISSGIEMLCIINPQAAAMDESEGWWADLMSTHPPIKKRIEVLLKMARVSFSELDKKMRSVTEAVSGIDASAKHYYALNVKQQWQGPFAITELAALPWLLPLTWISEGPDHDITRASGNEAINALFANRLKETAHDVSLYACPSCSQPLHAVSYEKTRAYQCNFCGGILVENNKIPRIIARREKKCTERVKSLAQAVIADNQKKLAYRKLKSAGLKTLPPAPCPKCKRPVFRTFYSLAYLIEIDKCSLCNITWFDADELEMLQCLIENKITVKIDIYQHSPE